MYRVTEGWSKVTGSELLKGGVRSQVVYQTALWRDRVIGYATHPKLLKGAKQGVHRVDIRLIMGGVCTETGSTVLIDSLVSQT